MAGSPALARFDRAATRYGVRLVMVTRVVPLVPYNVQNYVYGITGISLGPYALTSWLGMLPSTVAFAVAGGALSEGGWDPRRTLLVIGLAAALLRPGLAAAALASRQEPGVRRIAPVKVDAMLSIIVPVLDEAENLGRLLPHLRDRCPDAEVIVVDGGSRDRTALVARAWPHARYLASDRGRARQMNAGARAARGDVLLFLHADTLLPEGAPDAIVRALGRSGRRGRSLRRELREPASRRSG